MEKNRILIRLDQLHNQMEYIYDRMGNPSIETSEYRELSKKEKKLKKTIDKLEKKVYNGNK